MSARPGGYGGVGGKPGGGAVGVVTLALADELGVVLTDELGVILTDEGRNLGPAITGGRPGGGDRQGGQAGARVRLGGNR